MSKPMRDEQVKVGMIVYATINGVVVQAKVMRKIRMFCRIPTSYAVCPVGATSRWTHMRPASRLSLTE